MSKRHRKPKKQQPPEKRPGSRLTDHHRRASSIGGSRDWANRKDIPEDIHRMYHAVFENLCVPEAAGLLNKLIEKFGIQVRLARVSNPIHQFECPPSTRISGCCVSDYRKNSKVTHSRTWYFNELIELIGKEIGQSTSDEERVRYIIDNLFDADYADSKIYPR